MVVADATVVLGVKLRRINLSNDSVYELAEWARRWDESFRVNGASPTEAAGRISLILMTFAAAQLVAVVGNAVSPEKAGDRYANLVRYQLQRMVVN